MERRSQDGSTATLNPCGPDDRPGPRPAAVGRKDRFPAPTVLAECFEDLGTSGVAKERYYAPEFAERERTHLWGRVWNLACREEDIPGVGDNVVFEIADMSIIVVRSASDRIQAFHNVCLHRGMKLRATSGSCREFRCPYHSFTWSLEGKLTHTPMKWDFPHVKAEEFGLPECRVGSWEGFVFVNADPAAMPLDQYMENMPSHFKALGFSYRDRVKSLHVRKVIDCNWKTALDAFMEHWHLPSVHPQSLRWSSDEPSQIDLFPGQRHVNRIYSNTGLASTAVSAMTSELEIAADVYDFQRSTANLFEGEDVTDEQLEEMLAGRSARQFMADGVREQMKAAQGRSLDEYSDSQLMDAFNYFLFPNMQFWPVENYPVAFQWRPHPDSHEKCLMDFMMFTWVSPDQPRPAPAKVQELTAAQSWQDAEGMAGTGLVFDQDSHALPFVQKGLHAMRGKQITLSHYHEARIRHFNRTLDEYLAD